MSMFTFGLVVREPHSCYVGWRAIYKTGFIDTLPDRTSRRGDDKDVERLFDWVDKPARLEGEKRGKSPWKRMQEQVPRKLSGSDRENWEFREGNFVLRANPQASHGYLYIALFEEIPEPAQDPACAPP
jgi:hypothetical protein